MTNKKAVCDPYRKNEFSDNIETIRSLLPTTGVGSVPILYIDTKYNVIAKRAQPHGTAAIFMMFV